MKEHAPNLNERIAARVRELRAKQGVSLDALASRSGVSRSMISVIERGESSPTAVVLEKLAAGLSVPLASLFDAPAKERQTPESPVARRADQVEWKDPVSGYVRRNVSPAIGSPYLQVVEVRFPAGVRITFESGPGGRPFYQQIWMLDGSMNITVGKKKHELSKGDCLAMQIDQPTLFHNPTSKPARYAVIIAPEQPTKR